MCRQYLPSPPPVQTYVTAQEGAVGIGNVVLLRFRESGNHGEDG